MGQSLNQPTRRDHTLCAVRALIPKLLVLLPHVCHRQEIGLSPLACTCSRTRIFEQRSHIQAQFPSLRNAFFNAPPGAICLAQWIFPTYTNVSTGTHTHASTDHNHTHTSKHCAQQASIELQKNDVFFPRECLQRS